jgi:hypothetical protein
MNRKPRVLLCSEFSALNTGYSSIGHNLLTRFKNSQKYEILELACYISDNDPRIQSVGWQVVGNVPLNPQEHQAYSSNPVNQFGKYRFEEVCLKWRPDVVLDFRDVWMGTFINESFYRPFYKFVWSPTIDSAPQQPEWISQYCKADAILGYSDYAVNVLKEQGQDRIPLFGVAPPCPDDIFVPAKSKAQIKEMMGIDKNLLLVGGVLRNQKRKLINCLFDAFSKFLKVAPANISHKTYLYLHTSYPDMGFNIPSLLSEFGLSGKVYFSYKCRACGLASCSLFQDARAVCKRCQKHESCLPNTQIGYSMEEMRNVYNLFDVYVQYATAGSPELPIWNSAATATPTMTVDYAGMSDSVKHLKTTPIKVQRFTKESESGRYFALPDNDDFIEKLSKMLQLPSDLRNKRGVESMRLCKQKYSWDKTAKVWMDAIDQFEPRDWSETWDSPPRVFQPATSIPAGLSPVSFIEWAILNVLGDSKYINSYMATKLLSDLSNGMTQGGAGFVNFGVEQCMEHFLNMRNAMNQAEMMRAQFIGKFSQ